MEKISKNERIGVMVKILTDHPNQIFTLKYFKDLFSCAKSTLSEDIDTVRKIFEQFSLGLIETISGAAGGVVYRPFMSDMQIREVCDVLCEKIRNGERIIPGGYLYINDILYTPEYASQIGNALASKFIELPVNYVVAMEMKGIPIAQMTAKALDKPMVIIRRDNRVTEGTAININYVSGSSRRLQTMSLAKRAIERNSSVLFIDDFMRGGGTAKGIQDLMTEFECEVKGIGVLIATEEAKVHNVEHFVSLLTLKMVDEINKNIEISCSV